MDENVQRQCMIQLKQVTRVAAFPAYRQIDSFPNGVVVADEIALDFDNWFKWALGGLDAPLLTDQQRSCLIALDSRLTEMSGEHNSELWTEDALRCRPEWDHVREDAQEILDAFGWSLED